MVEEHANIEAKIGLADAVSALQAGKAVIVPTDTVYGLAVAVAYAESPALLYRIKGRTEEKPIAWLVASEADLDLYGDTIPEYAKRLAHDYWPGPLTLVVSAGERVPEAFRSQQGTIGMRVPEDELARLLCMRARSPLATSSANPSGKPAPRDLAAIDPVIIAQASIVLDDDKIRGGVASTVVDCTGDTPAILREGPVTAADIQALL